MSTTLERIQNALTGLQTKTILTRDGIHSLEVAVGDVHQCLERLRDRAGFDLLSFTTAIDRFPSEPRFDVLWGLLSIDHNDRVHVRVRLSGEAPRVASMTDMWPGAAYQERECFDMFGIVFEDHVGLKRLLMPEEYEHFPLRKDFPHQGIEPDRLYREWDRRRRDREPLREESS